MILLGYVELKTYRGMKWVVTPHGLIIREYKLALQLVYKLRYVDESS